MNESSHRFTVKILIGMLLGILVGLSLRWMPINAEVKDFLITDLFGVLGEIFLRLVQLLVVPIVLVSLICGASSLGNLRELGKIGGKSVLLYILTTAIAVSIALFLASWFHVGSGVSLLSSQAFDAKTAPTIAQVITDLVPSNPFHALTQGNMLQIIVFALLLGVAIAAVGEKGKPIAALFESVNQILLHLILLIMRTAPYGVFVLLAKLFATLGFQVFVELLGYFFLVLLVLAIQFFGCYSLVLMLLARLNPLIFFRKMYAVMLFAFSVSSSSASIPLVLKNIRERLGVSNSVASFVIPLGATINMDGTAIMQGVATVFIANAYHVSIGLTGYITVVVMATLASIGTAGVPSVGLITLSLVLRQLGLPASGIMLIIGIDRLLDMVRTAVNISGDSMVATVVAKSEKQLDRSIYDNKNL